MTALKLPAITRSMVIVYPTGRVTPAFQRFWQNLSLSADTTASELPGIKAQVTTNATAVTSLNGAVSSLTTTVTANYNSLQAQVTSNATAVAGLGGSIATLSDTVTANYLDLQGQVDVNAEAVSGLGGVYGRYGVKVSGGDQFAGFEVMAGDDAGTTVNYFKIAASEFQIQSPVGGHVQPFIYDATSGFLTVDNVKVRGDLIVDGTIVTSAIAPEAITTTTICPGAVTNPTIERNTVTFGVAAQFPLYVPLTTSGMTNIVTTSRVAKGARLRLSWQFEFVNTGPVEEGNLLMEVKVNGVAIRPYIAIIRHGTGEHRSFSANATVTPGASALIELQAQIADPGASTSMHMNYVWLDIDDFGTEA